MRIKNIENSFPWLPDSLVAGRKLRTVKNRGENHNPISVENNIRLNITCERIALSILNLFITRENAVDFENQERIK